MPHNMLNYLLECSANLCENADISIYGVVANKNMLFRCCKICHFAIYARTQGPKTLHLTELNYV